MASTFSSLKFELIATGEQSGTWGTTTNNNLSVALTEAIAGSTDVSFSSGTVTLTLSDTVAAQPARNLRLNLTGTSGGAQNLVVPAIEKSYLVNNGCADAITIKTPSGTGIAVAAGKTMWVYNNGTNVVDAVNHLTSLTLGTDLALTEGGTGASTAAAARTNLEVGITKKGSDFASGSPTVPTDGNYFDVTGTTTITAFTVAANRHFFCQFDGALQLTHNATDLDLPGEANITTAAGDVAEFFSTASNDVQCVNYTKADGTAVVASAGGGPSVGTNAVIRTNATNIAETINIRDHAATCTADASADTINKGTDDGFADNDTVQFENSGGALPAGLAAGTQYFVRDVAASTLKVSETFGGSAVNITGTGSGTHTIYQNINGMTSGPITIDSGTVTVPSGSQWNII
tara:strand:- start:7174 stop:8385 length:1212 start_codon:yes stop_codon:yes gene_type:complete